jgi:hypothetical protein
MKYNRKDFLSDYVSYRAEEVNVGEKFVRQIFRNKSPFSCIVFDCFNFCNNLNLLNCNTFCKTFLV